MRSIDRCLTLTLTPTIDHRLHVAQLRVSACNLLQGKKERRRYSVNRSYVGDYLNLEANPKLRQLLNDKRERVEFADLVTKYDRRGKVCCVLLSSDFSFYYVQLLHNLDVSLITVKMH